MQRGMRAGRWHKPISSPNCFGSWCFITIIEKQIYKAKPNVCFLLHLKPCFQCMHAFKRGRQSELSPLLRTWQYQRKATWGLREVSKLAKLARAFNCGLSASIGLQTKKFLWLKPPYLYDFYSTIRNRKTPNNIDKHLYVYKKLVMMIFYDSIIK